MKNSIFFFLKNFQFLEVKFSIYLNRRVFVMDEKERKRSRGMDLYFIVCYAHGKDQGPVVQNLMKLSSNVTFNCLEIWQMH